MNIVVATCKNRGIGIKNSLPWRLLADTYFFKYLTLGNEKNAVIMGKNTYLSLPKPLKHRDNIVLSTTINPKKYNIYSASSMIQVIPHLYKYENVYLIGGEQVYKEHIDSNQVKGIYHTRIDGEYDCDTYFPEIPNKYNKIQTIIFKDIDKNNNENVKFDIDIYCNTEFNDKLALNSENVLKESNMAIKKMGIYHDIFPCK
jgi:dihydrofolate reductase